MFNYAYVRNYVLKAEAAHDSLNAANAKVSNPHSH